MRAIALLALVACKHPGAAVATRDHHVPAITVSTSLPGASASTIASSITNPLERQFGQINRLEHMDSRSTFGESTIYLEFSVGTQLDRAEQDVQAAINAASSLLPQSLPAPPTYAKVGREDAVMRVAIAFTIPAIEISRIANDLAQRLSQVSGVGMVRICGGVRDGWQIHVDPVSLATSGKTILDVVAELRGGSIDLDHPDTLPLTRTVATIAHGGITEPCTALLGNRRAFVVSVEPQPGANVEDVRNQLESLVPALSSKLAPPVTLDVSPRVHRCCFSCTSHRRSRSRSATTSCLPSSRSCQAVRPARSSSSVRAIRIWPSFA
jgi:multidrug efflux pump